MARKLTINGVEYPIVECLGFSHCVGDRAWIVRTPDGKDLMAVGRPPRLWGANDRAAPLIEASKQGWPGPQYNGGIRGQ